MNKQRCVKMEKRPGAERGQGLVEYAMILVLVAVVIVVVLALIGPSIGGVYSEIMSALQNLGFSATAERTGGGHGNDLVLTVKATRQVALTMRDRQSGSTQAATCAAGLTCSFIFAGVGDAASAIDVSADGRTLAVHYAAK